MIINCILSLKVKAKLFCTRFALFVILDCFACFNSRFQYCVEQSICFCAVRQFWTERQSPTGYAASTHWACANMIWVRRDWRTRRRRLAVVHRHWCGLLTCIIASGRRGWCAETPYTVLTIQFLLSALWCHRCTCSQSSQCTICCMLQMSSISVRYIFDELIFAIGRITFHCSLHCVHVHICSALFIIILSPLSEHWLLLYQQQQTYFTDRAWGPPSWGATKSVDLCHVA